MIKVIFKKIASPPSQCLLLKDEYIPFSMVIDNLSILPDTIYVRNFYGENFIEFRFDANTNELYNITLVAIQKNTIITVDPINYKISDDFFTCLLAESSELEISVPIIIKRNNNSLSLSWDATLNFFPITHNCILGVNSESCLSSVILNNLSKNSILDILGF